MNEKLPISNKEEYYVEDPQGNVNIFLHVNPGERVHVQIKRSKLKETEKKSPLQIDFKPLHGRVWLALSKIPLEKWLFALALLLYLLTRFISLTQFPIYFFTDEAVQTNLANDLINNDFKNYDQDFLPTYFVNGNQYNLSFSVYLQVLPTLFFGRHVAVTRGTAVLATLAGALALSMILKRFFNFKHWWLGTLIFTTIPVWFLHSRTAFETTLMVSMYAVFLYFYLRYRYDDPKFLHLALLFGALSFYSYSPGQVVTAATALLLLFSDIRYHWQQRKTVLIGLGVLLLLAAPYIRFRITRGEEVAQHLKILRSYWLEPIPWYEKIGHYLLRYAKGINPLYWFFPNQVDIVRHIMKGYGHVSWFLLPFWGLGIWQCVKNWRSSAHRLLLIALLAAPTGAAIVDIGATRLLSFVVSATLLSALGIGWLAGWLEKRRLPQQTFAIICFVFLAGFSIFMCGDALRNGALWFEDYSLQGQQYGAQQLFGRIKEILAKKPSTRLVVSPTWTNGTDVVARFFFDDPLPFTMGTIESYAIQRQPLDRDTLFVMTKPEYDAMKEGGKFTNINIDETILNPDDTVAFYFVRLDYVADFDAILAEERAERSKLLEAEIKLDDRTLTVNHSVLDINEIAAAFDGNLDTLIRTLEANPLKLKINFDTPTQLNGLSFRIGGTATRITVSVYVDGQEAPLRFVQEAEEATFFRNLDFDFETTLSTLKIEVDVLNVNDGEIAHVHLWEVIFKD